MTGETPARHQSYWLTPPFPHETEVPGMIVRWCVLVLAVLALPLAAPRLASAQQRFPPDSLTNLEYYSKTIPVRALIDSMRQFTFALGVRCSYCHVGEEGQPLATYDFAKDDKRPKRTARVMLHMVEHINGEHLADVPERSTPPVVVTCETCHRGRSKPERLQDVLGRQLADSGLTATEALYARLRERYYGRAAFDFGEPTLNAFAEDLLRAGNNDAALGIAQLNLRQYPDYALGYVRLAEVHLARSDTASAVASIRTAMAKDSSMAGFLRRRLEALGATP